jgi:uncharacterized damage-inducible protein DinB
MPQIPVELRALFDRFAIGPSLLRQAVAGLDAGALNRRPPGEDWSIRDVVIHLADAELVGAVRFRLVIAEEGATLPVYDQDLWKRRLHYLWRDPEAAIALFQQTRYGSAELLQQCDAGTWSRSGLHPERGAMTLAALLELYADHVDQHIAQIAAFRTAT